MLPFEILGGYEAPLPFNGKKILEPYFLNHTLPLIHKVKKTRWEGNGDKIHISLMEDCEAVNRLYNEW